jgi:hypothetical protein
MSGGSGHDAGGLHAIAPGGSGRPRTAAGCGVSCLDEAGARAGPRAWRPRDHLGPWISKRPGLPSNRLADRSTGPALTRGRHSDPSTTPAQGCGRRILGDRPSPGVAAGVKPPRMLPQSQGPRLRRRRCNPSSGPATCPRARRQGEAGVARPVAGLDQAGPQADGGGHPRRVAFPRSS